MKKRVLQEAQLIITDLSKSKPDLAGSKENLPGQNQAWSLP